MSDELLRGRVFKLRVTNDEIKRQLLNNMRASTFAWNWGLYRYLEIYKELNDGSDDIKFPPVNKTMSQISKEFTQFKKTEKGAWLNTADSNATTGVLSSKGTLVATLNTFVKNYYTKGKQKDIWKPILERKKKGKVAEFPRHAGGFPKFQRNQSEMSYYTDGRGVKIIGNQIHLPKVHKLGLVSVWNWGDLPTDWNQAVSVSTDGDDFYVSMISHREPEPLGKELSGVLGIDLGLKVLATLSDGTKIMNPADLPEAKRLESLIKHYQHRYSVLMEHADIVELPNGKKVKHKSRRAKRVHQLMRRRQIDLNNVKKTYMKQMASKIKSAGYKYIVFEDLNIQGMKKNKKLSPKLQKTGMYSFKVMVKYMTEPYGTQIIEADRFFASSQICSACGYKHKEMKELSKRTFECPSCGAVIDRDENAAINLRNLVDKFEVL